jgi:predicted pyridoxine 5'-phosphate oxidase superfamily flavin-nucleotide-binding protein
MGEPVRPVVEKVLDHLDDVSRKIIEKSPFIVVASASGNGYPDISPKGEIST